VFQHFQQVLAISVFLHRLGNFLNLSGIDIAQAEGNFFNTGNLDDAVKSRKSSLSLEGRGLG